MAVTLQWYVQLYLERGCYLKSIVVVNGEKMNPGICGYLAEMVLVSWSSGFWSLCFPFSPQGFSFLFVFFFWFWDGWRLLIINIIAIELSFKKWAYNQLEKKRRINGMLIWHNFKVIVVKVRVLWLKIQIKFKVFCKEMIQGWKMKWLCLLNISSTFDAMEGDLSIGQSV